MWQIPIVESDPFDFRKKKKKVGYYHSSFIFIVAFFPSALSCFKTSHWKKCALISSSLAEALRLNLHFCCMEPNLLQQETIGFLGILFFQDFTRDLVMNYWGHPLSCKQKRARMNCYLCLVPASTLHKHLSFLWAPSHFPRYLKLG